MENVENTEKVNGLSDLLVHAIEKRPNEFQDAFNDLLTQRIADRLETAKQEVAANYFNYVQDEENVEETGEQSEEQDTTDEVEENGQDAESV